MTTDAQKALELIQNELIEAHSDSDMTDNKKYGREKMIMGILIGFMIFANILLWSEVIKKW